SSPVPPAVGVSSIHNMNDCITLGLNDADRPPAMVAASEGDSRSAPLRLREQPAETEGHMQSNYWASLGARGVSRRGVLRAGAAGGLGLAAAALVGCGGDED